MHITIRTIGNSKGVVIPKAMLAQVGLQDAASIAVENDAIVLRKPTRPVRQGWAQAAAALAVQAQDEPLLGEFPNDDDEALAW